MPDATNVLFTDALRDRAARQSCDALLRAHLKAGQHLLSFSLAKAVAIQVGLPLDQVRPAASDPTIIGRSA